MPSPKLPSEEYEKKEEPSQLIAILNDFQSSNNPDISYLSRKARNFFSNHKISHNSLQINLEVHLMELNNSKALMTRDGIERRIGYNKNTKLD